MLSWLGNPQMGDEPSREVVPAPQPQPLVPELMMLQMTAQEADLVRKDLAQGHPITRFLQRQPVDQLGPRTAAFQKIRAAAKAEHDATRWALRVEQLEGHVTNLNTLRARNAELEEALYDAQQAVLNLQTDNADLVAVCEKGNEERRHLYNLLRKLEDDLETLRAKEHH